MSTREAIQILMLSPLYFRLTPSQRKTLVEEFSLEDDGGPRKDAAAYCSNKGYNNNGFYMITKLSAVG